MIDVTYIDASGIKFNRRYKSKGAFIKSYSKMKNATLDNAVDYSSMSIIRPDSYNAYKNMH
jgi:hypothetical protein